MEIFSQVVFPIFGILLIVLGVGAFFFKYGSRLQRTQKLSFLGVSLEISAVTGIIIAGMAFCGLGFYLNENSYQQKYISEQKNNADFHAQIELKDRMIAFMKTQDITYQLVLDDDDDDENSIPPSAQSLTCVFHKNWDQGSDSVEYKVTACAARKAYKVTFKNLSLQEFADAAPYIYLVDKNTKKKWYYHSFNPLTPTIFLKNQ